MKLKSNLLALLAVTVACGFITQQSANAGGGKSSTTPDTSTAPSNKPAAGGGGGGRSTTPTPTPTPTPAPVLSSGPITFAAAGPVYGTTPVCIGDYRIGAYYPTLLDMTVNVSVSSLNVPDGTVLYVNVVGTGLLYPYTSNAIVIIGGAGVCSEKLFVGLNVGLAGVTISDASGAILFAGN